MAADVWTAGTQSPVGCLEKIVVHGPGSDGHVQAQWRILQHGSVRRRSSVRGRGPWAAENVALAIPMAHLFPLLRPA